KQIGLASFGLQEQLGGFVGGQAAAPSFNVAVAGPSWFYRILPFIEQDALYKKTVNTPWNQALLPVLSVYRCPRDPWQPERGWGNYACSMGPQCWPGLNNPSWCGSQSCACQVNNTYCNQPTWGYTTSADYSWGATTPPKADEIRGVFHRGNGYGDP